jgi:hypothetical protein
MLPRSNAILSLASFFCLCGMSTAAFAQAVVNKPAAAKPAAGQSNAASPAQTGAPMQASSSAQAPAPAVGPAAAQQSAPAATATPATYPAGPSSTPMVAPAPTLVPPPMVAPVAVIPPGYALVPIESAAQTRYDVEYPQHQGALPPGMELPYEEGEPVPPGYRVVRQSRRGLVIAGSIVGGIAYGFSITGAVSDDFNHKSGSLLVPVLGPWLMLALGGAKDKCSGYSNYDSMTGEMTTCSNSGLRSMLVLDGLAQLAGATMLTIGIAYPKTRLVRKDVTISMAPIPVGKGGYGLGAVGSF